MKSKFLLAFLACWFFSASLSAQCYTHMTYQQTPGTTSVTFYADSSSGGTFFYNYVYNWSFGDGTSGYGSPVTHTFNSTFAYVCLTLTDTSNGCTFTTCDSINISGNAGGSCSTSISYTHVDSLYTFVSSNSGAAPYNYVWALNGSMIGASATSSFSFVVPQVLNGSSNQICVSVTDTTGCISSDCVYVYDTLVNTCSTYASYTNQDSLYTFTASHIGGTPALYQWTYNNNLLGVGSPLSVVLDSVQLSGGTVCVSITDANACVSTDCISFAGPVAGGGCQAYFMIYPDTVNGAAGYYTGTNLSTGSFGSNVLWDFGDGTTSTSPYPSHTYSSPGQYTICLTVGAAGTSCYDTYCDSSFYAYKTSGGLMSHLTISSPTGITEASANAALSIYPNPVNDKLNISTTSVIIGEKIFNVDGQLLFERKTGNEINVSKFPAGVYVLELTSDAAVSRMKFVKE